MTALNLGRRRSHFRATPAPAHPSSSHPPRRSTLPLCSHPSAGDTATLAALASASVAPLPCCLPGAQGTQGATNFSGLQYLLTFLALFRANRVRLSVHALAGDPPARCGEPPRATPWAPWAAAAPLQRLAGLGDCGRVRSPRVRGRDWWPGDARRLSPPPRPAPSFDRLTGGRPKVSGKVAKREDSRHIAEFRTCRTTSPPPPRPPSTSPRSGPWRPWPSRRCSSDRRASRWGRGCLRGASSAWSIQTASNTILTLAGVMGSYRRSFVAGHLVVSGSLEIAADPGSSRTWPGLTGPGLGGRA